ncbi:MAG TPA: cation:proton antiporter [Jatrophihabitantaceae bacterium]
MAQSEIAQLTWVALAAVAAPAAGLALRRWAVPGVVLELTLGVLLGPVLLDWVVPTGLVESFANFGLGLLMFLAGLEMNLSAMRGPPLRLAGLSWAGSLLGALIVAVVLLVSGHRHAETVIALSLTTTALGTLLPILRDAHVLDSPFGRHMLAIGSIGEFGPIVLVALFLSGAYPLLTVVLLAGFLLVAAGIAFAAARPWGRSVTNAFNHGLHSSSQLPVRVAMVLVIGLEFLTTELGLDVLLGAFGAGIVVRVAITDLPDTEKVGVFLGKLEAIGFGLFVPIFFIVSGASLDLKSFAHNPAALAAIPVFVVLLLIVRGVPTLLCYRRIFPPRQTAGIALLSATGLPLIVVITTIGTANHYIATQTGAALVAAGVVSVLVFPTAAMRITRATAPTRRPTPTGPDDPGDAL